MTPPVFLAAPGSLAVGRVRLEGPEGRHAVVRRLEVGERVDLVDGAGGRGTGVVATVMGRDGIEVDLTAVAQEPAPAVRLVVAQALAKGDRGELAVELLTEAGVDEVLPWAAERCVVRWSGERGDRSLARWRSSADEAAKQARRARWPRVGPAASTAELAARGGSCALAVLLHEEALLPLGSLVLPVVGDVLLAVGPEGGVGKGEQALLAAAGFVPARVGPTVLRTSTAGVVGLAVLSAKSRWA